MKRPCTREAWPYPATDVPAAIGIAAGVIRHDRQGTGINHRMPENHYMRKKPPNQYGYAL
jgi:hypothetical protein